VLIAAAGCAGSNKKYSALREKIYELTDQNEQLSKQLEQTTAENEQLAGQVRVLSGLPDEVKGKNIYVLEKVTLTKHTNFYDKDGNGSKEKLLVYLQPIDKDGDIIKATGEVEIELWDLSKEESQAKLAQWKVATDDLAKLWFSTLMRTNYRLTFDAPDGAMQSKEPLTVKVTFTDYLSGKTFKQQHVIEP